MLSFDVKPTDERSTCLIAAPSFQSEFFRWWPMASYEARSTLSTGKRSDVVFVCVKIFQITAGSRIPLCQARVPDEGRKRFGYVNELKS
jgi:hypothetical protein